MKKMFKVLLFPIWLVLEIIVFVLKLVMVLSSTVLGILLRILIPMAFVAMLLSVRNGLMLLAFAWLISRLVCRGWQIAWCLGWMICAAR